MVVSLLFFQNVTEQTKTRHSEIEPQQRKTKSINILEIVTYKLKTEK